MEERAYVRVQPGGHAVEIGGDADLRSADDLDAAIAGLAGSNQTVVVDLSQATLLDSRIIAVLAAWARRLRARGGSLPIAGADPNIHHLFELIGLDREFDFHVARPGG